jgi:hypothetical protein
VKFVISRLGVEEPDHRQCRLLSPRHHRPRRRAPEPRDELPPSHLSSPRLIGGAYRGPRHVETAPLPSLRRYRSAPMTVPLLTLMVLLVAFAAEVGWICMC